MSDILLTNVAVIDGTGAAPFAGEVLVRGDRIRQVGAAGSVRRDGARTVDGGGATLMPGLCDAHAHMSWLNQPNRNALREMPLEEHVLATAENARNYLDHGYTMAVSGGAAKPRLDVVVRDAIANAKIPGPRLLANGPPVTTNRDLSETQTEGKRHFVDVEIVDGPAAMSECVERLLAQPVDFLKLTMSGEEVTGVPARQTLMTDEEVAVAVGIAKARGVRVCAHARSAESVKICARQGVTLIYHASFCDDELLDALESVKDDVFVAPGLNWLYATCFEAEPWGMSPARAKDLGYVDELEAAVETMKLLRRRGVRILPGGDYGFAWCPHGTYARDLEHFVKLLGFSPMEAIVSATRTGGELMQLGAELGQIRPGFLADLILVQGNPIDDIAVLQDATKIKAVMKNGVFHREAAQ